MKLLAEHRILSVPLPIGPQLEFDAAISLRVRALALCLNEPGSLRWWERHADFWVLLKQLEARRSSGSN